MKNCYLVTIVFLVTSTTNAQEVARSTKTCGVVNRRADKIFGGEKTEINEYPWHVGLFSTLFGSSRTSRSFFFCGGSIINEKWILTAAHCFNNPRLYPNNTFVDVGEHDWSIDTDTSATQRYSCEKILKDPDYSQSTKDSDVALIKLAGSLLFNQYNNKVAPICPPILNKFYRGVEAITTGWGRLSGGGYPKSLREVTITTMAKSKCQSDYLGKYTITWNMTCAGVPEGGNDSCKGDSGGPLITADGPIYRQIGVVSFGDGCGIKGKPGVYTRITSKLTWIQKSISPTIWSPPKGSPLCTPPSFVDQHGQCARIVPTALNHPLFPGIVK